jgi:hypothetical protein
MSSICTSNLTSGFIDLATYDEQEKYLYGGEKALTYFVGEVTKATWFTQVPVVLSRASGQAQFNQEWSATVSRAGDYLMYAWLRTIVPSVTAVADNIRWTDNLGHNLIRECCITFNDLVCARFDSYHLDFWSAFTVPASKVNGYANMIGNTTTLTTPAPTLPQYVLNVPLPFFFCRDTGVALPTAALPYNDIRINFSFRNWSDLLIYVIGPGTTPRPPTVAEIGGTEPQLTGTQVWANYAIVSNQERKRMACAPRNILIEQAQTAPIQSFTPATNASPSYDIRFSHAIKAIFFSGRNKTISSSWSNYTSDRLPDTGTIDPSNPPEDSIINTTLIYENTQRLYQMGSDYFSLVNPFYHSPAIPVANGYHMYSYSLKFIDVDPKGSTNYGKLTNVSIVPTASARAITQAGLGDTFDFIVTAVNNNIIRVSGGAVGFPVL